MLTVTHNFDMLADYFRMSGTELSARVGDFWNTCADYMQRKTMRCFRNQVDAGGAPFAPLQPLSVMLRRKGRAGSKRGSKVLQDTGRMMRSTVAMQTSPADLALFNNLPYAHVHQDGATIRITEAMAWAVSFKAYKFDADPFYSRPFSMKGVSKETLSDRYLADKPLKRIKGGKKQRSKARSVWLLHHNLMKKGYFRIPKREFLAFSAEDATKLQGLFIGWANKILKEQGDKAWRKFAR